MLFSTRFNVGCSISRAWINAPKGGPEGSACGRRLGPCQCLEKQGFLPGFQIPQ